MKIWFNKTFSCIAFVLEALQNNPLVTTLYSHTQKVDYQRFADEFIYEPENCDDYLTFCLDVCRQQQVDVFYPWRHLSLLYPHREQFAALGVTVIFPCSDINFHIIDNKATFYRHLLAKKMAINIPLFATAKTKADFIAQYRLLRVQVQKLCMKPSISIYAAGFKIIHDEADYDPWQALLYGHDKFAIAYSQLIHLLPEKWQEEIMLLDFLPGDEYSHDILCHHGKLIAGTIRQKHHAYDKYQFLIQHAEIERMSRLLVQEFQLSGFINIQYRDDKDGVAFVLEINPRISGGFPKISLAGIDYVDLFLKLLHGQEITAQDIKQDFGIKVANDNRYIKL
jgi:predicted ATP-grasp superfamily ATP-dependent carboligase